MADQIDAQNAALDAYNVAIGRIQTAQQRVEALQSSPQPSDDKYILDYKQAQAELAAAQSDAAKAATQYATFLEQQAQQEERLNDPNAAARADRARAQADYYKARAEGLATKDAAAQQAAQDRANAALTRANAAASRVDAQNAQANATAGHTAAETATIQEQQAQRAANQAAGKGGLTDAEVAAQQQRNREISVQEANTAISAANQRLAAQRADIENRLADNTINLDQAKFEYQKVKDAADQDIQQQTLKLQQAQQTATQAYQQGQLANQQGQLANQQAQLAETTRSNVAQEGLRSSDQARAAAGDILSAGQNAAQTGAGLLNQRVSAGTSLLNQFTGLAGQSKMLSVPAGLGQGLVSGVQDYVTGLGGGQGVYDTAAKAVQNLIPGGAGNPMASQAYAVLGQLLDRYQQETGQEHPVASAVANQSTAPQQQFASPAATSAGGGGTTINIFHSPQQMADTNMAPLQRGPLSG